MDKKVSEQRPSSDLDEEKQEYDLRLASNTRTGQNFEGTNPNQLPRAFPPQDTNQTGASAQMPSVAHSSPQYQSPLLSSITNPFMQHQLSFGSTQQPLLFNPLVPFLSQYPSQMNPAFASARVMNVPPMIPPAAAMLYPQQDPEPEETGTSSSKKRGQRRKLEEGHPVQPLSAYNIFFKRERQRILKEKGINEDDQDNTKGRKRRQKHNVLSFQEMARTISARWKEVSSDPDNEELLECQRLNKLEKERYASELAAFRKKQIDDFQSRKKRF